MRKTLIMFVVVVFSVSLWGPVSFAKAKGYKPSPYVKVGGPVKNKSIFDTVATWLLGDPAEKRRQRNIRTNRTHMERRMKRAW